MPALAQEERVISAIDKVPPQNIDAEQSTLGSMMIETSALEIGIQMLEPEDFYRPVHQEIFDALRAIADQNEPADLITTQEELRKRKKLDDCGGTEYLMALVESVPTAANIKHYANIVLNKSILRKIMAAGSEIIGAARNEDEEVEAICAKAQQLIYAATQKRGDADREYNLWTAAAGVAKDIDVFATEGYGQPIGLAPLAHCAIAMPKKYLIVIGGRAGDGKNALAGQLLRYLAVNYSVPVADFSTEMSKEQNALRFLVTASEVNLVRVLKGRLEDHHRERIRQVETYLEADPAPYYCVDCCEWTIERIRSKARQLVARGVKIISIDHVQDIAPTYPKQSRREQVGHIMRQLKAMAVELDIPVIALSQLTRESEKRGLDRKSREGETKWVLPTKADLMEAGEIEAKADHVLLISRYPYRDGEPKPQIEPARIVQAKHRMLPQMVIKVGFHGKMFEFCALEEEQQAPAQATFSREEF